MLGKVEILVVIIVLLLAFYFVISWGAGKRKGSIAMYLEPHHADIFPFLDLRKNFGFQVVQLL